MVRGLVHTTLDTNRWQLHAVQRNVQMHAKNIHQTLKVVAMIQIEASIKAKGQLYCYLSITSISPYVVSPTHLTLPGHWTARGYVYRLIYRTLQLYW